MPVPPKKLKHSPASPLSRLDEALKLGLISPQQHALLSTPPAKATVKDTPPPSFYTHTIGGRSGETPVPSDPYISGLLCTHPDDPSVVVYFCPIYLNTAPSTWKKSPALDKMKQPILSRHGTPIINTLVGESRITESLLTVTLPDPVTGRPHTIHLSAFARLSASPLSLEDAEEKHLSTSAADRDGGPTRKEILDKRARDAALARGIPLRDFIASNISKSEESLTLDELEARESLAASLPTPRPTYTKDGYLTPTHVPSTGAGGSSIGHSLDLDISDSNSAPFIPSLAGTPDRHGTRSEPFTLRGGID